MNSDVFEVSRGLTSYRWMYCHVGDLWLLVDRRNHVCGFSRAQPDWGMSIRPIPTSTKAAYNSVAADSPTGSAATSTLREIAGRPERCIE